jgi:hypothetical protein
MNKLLIALISAFTVFAASAATTAVEVKPPEKAAAVQAPASGAATAAVANPDQAHGGVLALADTPGGGLTVLVMLPLSEAD